MKKGLRSFFRYTAIGRALYVPPRFILGCTYVFPQFTKLIEWTFASRETDNFTYDLTDLNKKYLTAYISQVTHVSYANVSAYVDEVDHNKELIRHIRKSIQKSPDQFHIDKTMYLGRRIGWYVLVRIHKPKIVVETGVEKGLGACVLTSALALNAKEGYRGIYYGTEIDSTAGNLFVSPYNKFGKILFGDSVHTLKKFQEKIDIFIHDSNHDAGYETREYTTIRDKLSPRAFIVSDNAHYSDSLLKFARKTGRQFLFFGEKPKNHWYPGAGIGIAFNE